MACRTDQPKDGHAFRRRSAAHSPAADWPLAGPNLRARNSHLSSRPSCCTSIALPLNVIAVLQAMTNVPSIPRQISGQALGDFPRQK